MAERTRAECQERANFGLTGKVRRCPEADTIKLRVVVATLPDQGNIPVYPSPMEGTRLDREWERLSPYQDARI